MYNKRRNWIMVSVAIIEVFVVIFLVARVVQTCCTSPATTALPTLVALNPSPATQTTAAPVVVVPSLTATPIPDTATPDFSPSPSPTSTSATSPVPPSPTSTPTASVTALPNTPTSTTAPAIAATTIPSSTSLPVVVIQSTSITLPTIPIPTAVPTVIPSPTASPTKHPITPFPTMTATPTATSNDPTATSTVTATRSPTPQASGQCSWGWAIQPLPAVTDAAQSAINSAGLKDATATSQAYGENCYDTISHELLFFGAMYTDFYLTLPVSDLNDFNAMGQIVVTAFNTFTTLPIALPARPGLLNITFNSSSEQKLFRAQFDGIRPLIVAGTSGADLLAAGGIK